MALSSFHIKRHDTAPPIEETLEVNGEAVDIANATVRFLMQNARSRELVLATDGSNDQVGDGSDGTRGHVSYDWSNGGTAQAGTYLIEWEVTFADGTRRTFPNPGFTTVIVHGDLG